MSRDSDAGLELDLWLERLKTLPRMTPVDQVDSPPHR
jgi:hypothetical protein